MHWSRERTAWAAFALLVLVVAFVWYVVHEAHPGVLSVAFLDVGQGDAIFIESPVGNQVLIDGGPDRGVLRALGEVMPFYDRSIDVLVATHPDEDHIGGLSDVLETYRVGVVFRTDAVAETGSYDAFSALSAAEPGGREVYAVRGHVIDLGGGVVLRVLFPEVGTSASESNAGSIVIQVIFGETQFLLTGDAPRAVETYLTTRDGSTLASDVLKAGHHGSRTSSVETFVRTVDPTYVVISAGKDNSYGHPHQEVLDVFRSIGAEVIGTYERGTVVFESDGEEVTRTF